MGARTAAIKPSRIQRSHSGSARPIADSLRIAAQRHEGTGTFGPAAQPTRTSLPTSSRLGRDFALIPAFTAPRGPRIQAKLEIGAMGDPLEREAGQVADRGCPKCQEDHSLPRAETTSAAAWQSSAFSPSRHAVTAQGHEIATQRDRSPSPISVHRQEQAPVLAEPQLSIGSSSDPLEAVAERAASAPRAITLSPAGRPASARPAPAIVSQALASPGKPLDTVNRTFFEGQFGNDFSHVRLHSGDLATRSADAIGARAYTVADHVVLGRHGADPGLLAHEMAHVVQQRGAHVPWVQRQTSPAKQPKPRQDFVFIMGADKKGTRNPFYHYARRYFRAHVPKATFVEDKRTFTDLLKWVSSNVSDPIGNLYIVAHGNEDGTLAFGLDSSSHDAHTSVIDLRNALHPGAGQSSSLPSVASVIDTHTKIHIKGCDIGRTKEIVELIDEAFGGRGTVTAPTHEQDYSTDPTLGAQARKSAHDKRIADFTAHQAPLPAAPGPIDPKLKGNERKLAQHERQEAVKARAQTRAEQKKAVVAEEKHIKPELDAIAEKAQTVDSLSGPMFQRPGTKLFKIAEVQPEVDRLYSHLSKAQRLGLAKRLIAPNRGGPEDQQGQRVQRVTPFYETFSDPQSLNQGKALFREGLRERGFHPIRMKSQRNAGDLEITFTDASSGTLTFTEQIPDDAKLIAAGRVLVPNPDRYQWSVTRSRDRSGHAKVTAVGERVMAYLHHGSLDASPHDHFSKPENDPNFYATSVLAPPHSAGSPAKPAAKTP